MGNDAGLVDMMEKDNFCTSEFRRFLGHPGRDGDSRTRAEDPDLVLLVY